MGRATPPPPPVVLDPEDLESQDDDRVRTGRLPDVRPEADRVMAERAARAQRHRDEQIARDMLEAERASLLSSEWAADVNRQLADHTKDLTALAPMVTIAEAAKKRSSGSMGAAAVAFFAAAVSVYGWVGARGEARADGRAERARMLEDRLELRAMRSKLELVKGELERVKGELEGLRPFRVLRPRAPDLEPDPQE